MVGVAAAADGTTTSAKIIAARLRRTEWSMVCGDAHPSHRQD
jgi:hypothetical protein